MAAKPWLGHLGLGLQIFACYETKGARLDTKR